MGGPDCASVGHGSTMPEVTRLLGGKMRALLVVQILAFAVIATAACSSPSESAEPTSSGSVVPGTSRSRGLDPRVDEFISTLRAQQDEEYPRLTSADYSTTVDCTARQGIYPAARGTLTSRMKKDLTFQVWVVFRTSDGGAALSLAYTDAAVPAGGTGSWSTFTVRARKISSCEVVCVDQMNPYKNHVHENCQEWVDQYRRHS